LQVEKKVSPLKNKKMESIEAFKKRLYDLLLQYDGDVRLENHPNIIKEAETLGLDKRQLSKLLQEIHSTINWKEKAAREEALKKAIEEKKKIEQNAGVLLPFIIDQCAKDNVFDAGEIKRYFDTSDELHQDENISAQLIKGYFDKNNYLPLAMKPANSLRTALQSTSWYKDNLPIQQTPATQPAPSSPFPRQAIIIAAALLLSVAGYFIYLWIIDRNAPKMYSYANSIMLRSSQVSGAEYNIVDKLPYGAELLVYSLNNNWAKCKSREKEGFVAAQFILPEKEFHELNSIISDAQIREAIPTTKCRKALLNYFTKKGIMGKMDQELQKELYGAEQNKEVWQLVSNPKNNNLKTITYPPAVNPNSRFTDFACLIQNTDTGKRRFLLFSFNDKEEPLLVTEQDAPDYGYIGNISRSNNNVGVPINVAYVE
jgi:hypothetical protein